MPSMQLIIWVLLVVCISFGAAQNCSSYSTCGSCDIIDYNNDLIAFLDQGPGDGFTQFYDSATAAINIMCQYPGVITNDDWILHMTIDYLCCYSVVTYGEIINIIAGVAWEPLNITFSNVICNYGGDGFSGLNSIVVMLDDDSQARAQAFIERFEAAINASGIPIHLPRSEQEPFHSTLGVVEGSYPIEEVIAQINQQLPVFNQQPIEISSFFSVFPPWIFNSNSSSSPVDELPHDLPFYSSRSLQQKVKNSSILKGKN